MFYGFGVRIGEGPGLQLRVEYDRMEVDNADVDMGSVNLQYLFRTRVRDPKNTGLAPVYLVARQIQEPR